MKIILRQKVESLGKPGDMVEVKPGYARNYLIPKKMALIANPQNRKMIEEEKRLREIRKNKEKVYAKRLAEKIQNLSLTATVSVGEDDKVFGSITSQNISALLKEKGYSIDRKNILLEEPIKSLGIYNVLVKLHPEVTCEIKIWVIKE
jgi:large subunit ribosomal protein L9